MCESIEDEFCHFLEDALAKITDTQEVLICGDFNGDIGANAVGYEGVHEGLAFRKKNVDGEGFGIW